MNNLKQTLKRPLASVGTVTVAVFFVVALLGFADAAFLTVEHYRGVIPPCSITSGCEKVLASQYSVILGVPASLLGALYYLAIALAAFIYLESRHGAGKIESHHSAILKWALFATVAGFLMSLWFVYLQAFVIHSYCQYCLGSALTSTVLFVMAMDVLRKNENRKNENV